MSWPVRSEAGVTNHRAVGAERSEAIGRSKAIRTARLPFLITDPLTYSSVNANGILLRFPAFPRKEIGDRPANLFRACQIIQDCETLPVGLMDLDKSKAPVLVVDNRSIYE